MNSARRASNYRIPSNFRHFPGSVNVCPFVAEAEVVPEVPEVVMVVMEMRACEPS
jgi:hypothetical protein